MVDCVAICIKTPRIDSKCSLEKGLIKLIHINLLLVLCLNFNQVNLYHGECMWSFDI